MRRSTFLAECESDANPTADLDNGRPSDMVMPSYVDSKDRPCVSAAHDLNVTDAHDTPPACTREKGFVEEIASAIPRWACVDIALH